MVAIGSSSSLQLAIMLSSCDLAGDDTVLLRKSWVNNGIVVDFFFSSTALRNLDARLKLPWWGSSRSISALVEHSPDPQFNLAGEATRK